MTTIIPVKFKYSLRELWFDPKETGAREADHVIVTTERGTEIGLAVGDPCEVDDETLEATIGTAPLQNVLRIATEADLAHAEHLAELGEKAMPIFRKHVHESGLDMKPVGVEYLFGGEKVVCYFAAEDRVDFRQLVRELSHELHARIDMRQIGVREEAAIVGGYGHCGQELCCRRFGHEFQPVSIRMAKEQDLPLNSSKISGACGRLMCCLRYEFEAYRDFKSRAPKRNAVIDTPLGKAVPGDFHLTRRMVALLRLLLPEANIPATTAMETMVPHGRELILASGANVVMPNVTEGDPRRNYALYPGKVCVADTPAACRSCMSGRIRAMGRFVAKDKGFRRHRQS